MKNVLKILKEYIVLKEKEISKLLLNFELIN